MAVGLKQRALITGGKKTQVAVGLKLESSDDRREKKRRLALG